MQFGAGNKRAASGQHCCSRPFANRFRAFFLVFSCFLFLFLGALHGTCCRGRRTPPKRPAAGENERGVRAGGHPRLLCNHGTGAQKEKMKITAVPHGACLRILVLLEPNKGQTHDEPMVCKTGDCSGARRVYLRPRFSVEAVPALTTQDSLSLLHYPLLACTACLLLACTLYGAQRALETQLPRKPRWSALSLRCLGRSSSSSLR